MAQSKESACNAGDLGSIPGLGRSPGEGNGSPLQYSCLENSITEEPGRLQFMGLQRVGHDWVTNTFTLSRRGREMGGQWSTQNIDSICWFKFVIIYGHSLWCSKTNTVVTLKITDHYDKYNNNDEISWELPKCDTQTHVNWVKCYWENGTNRLVQCSVYLSYSSDSVNFLQK